MVRNTWTGQEIAAMAKMADESKSLHQAANALRRTYNSVVSKADYENIRFHGVRRNGWTEEMTALLVRMVDEKKSPVEVASILRMTRNAVIGRTHRIGIRFHSGRGNFPGRIAKDKSLAKVVPAKIARAPRDQTDALVRSIRAKPARTVENKGTLTIVGVFGSKADHKMIALPPDPFQVIAMFQSLPNAGEPISILDLTETRCHWPIDSPNGVLYCGEVIEAKTSHKSRYCCVHAKAGTIPIRPRAIYVRAAA